MAQSLNQNLILNKYFLGLLGMENVEQLQAIFSKVPNGFSESGESFVAIKMKTKEEYLKNIAIPSHKIIEYDNNIKNYINHIAKHRDLGFSLMYFQYLAIFFTEYYLDHLFSDKQQFLADLNSFVEEKNKNIKKDTDKYSYFLEKDLSKLAYYQATGSGKTLIGHINYLQYLHYYNKHNNQPLDMIIMITPNESLSKQNMEEFIISGIQAEPLTIKTGIFQGNYGNSIQITEITKLKEDKTGNGESIAVESFEGKKLVMIEEGHRGTSGEQWKKIRNMIGEDSFTFEYSATFGQAIGKDKELIEEYGKSVIFDYSYKYFHKDGYGKDYNIVNLKENIQEDQQFTFMVGNLLTFLEQQVFFGQSKDIVKEYNLELPLWVFVGNSVSSTATKDKSDIMEVVSFFDKVIKNKEETINTIKNILSGTTTLKNENGVDLFDNKLKYLKDMAIEGADRVYSMIQEHIFHSKSNGNLHIVEIKNSKGELGLRTGNNDYWGVINVGETKGIIKMAENEKIITDTDNFSQSLFDNINKDTSKIQVLIGSKKFSEGWNSYRVSCMGLLNMGKGEGSQIIQLFGRGVRLKGIGNCLKRSEMIDGVIKEGKQSFFVRTTLETLYIFGLKADYMEKFRDYLQNEGIETEQKEEVVLPVILRKDIFGKNLKIPKIKKGLEYNEGINLMYDNGIAEISKIIIDISLKVGELSSLETEQQERAIQSKTTKLKQELFGLYDWNYIYFVIQEYKKEKKYNNITFNKEVLQEIIEKKDWYDIIGEINESNLQKKIKKEQEVAISLLKKYITKFFNYKKQEWESDKMEYGLLEQEDSNIIKEYTLKIPKNQKELIKEIKDMKGDIETLLKSKQDLFSTYTINFDKHLYKPLFVKERYSKITNPIQTSPEGLNKNEVDFIEKLEQFLENTNYETIWKNKDYYLLRNLKKAEGGISFFQAHNFSPDFILWVIDGNQQHIVFIDPKGLRELDNGINNIKIQLHNTIKEKEKLLNDNNTHLHSFILSGSKYDSMKKLWNIEKKQFIENGVIFMEDMDFINQVLSKVI